MSSLKKILPRKRWQRRTLTAASTLLVLLAADMLWVRACRRITVAPDTTAIITPLAPDGLPDYVTALNERYSRGVTRENNAAPLLLQVLGTDRFDAQWRAQMLPQLGLLAEPSLPSRLTEFLTWAQKLPVPRRPRDMEIDQQDTDMSTHPWKQADHPLWQSWLEPQQPALADARSATVPPRYYVPWGPPQQLRRDLAGDFVSGHSGIAGILPSLRTQRGVANVLRVDAMRAAGENDWATYRADVMAIFRLSRLIGQGPSNIERLVSVAVNAIAVATITNTLRHANLPPEEITRLQADIDNLPPLCTFDDSTDILQRWITLENCQYAARLGVDRWHSLQLLFVPIPLEKPTEPQRSVAWWIAAQTVPVSFDPILRQENAAYDRMVAALRIPSYADRIAAVRKLSAEFSVENPGISDLLLHPPRVLMADTFRSYDKIVILVQRTLVTHDMARLALALALFHAKTGTYPDALKELINPAGTFRTLPQDGFSGKDFVYHRAAAGYILYSVGDEGRDEDDSKELKWRVVRMEH